MDTYFTDATLNTQFCETGSAPTSLLSFSRLQCVEKNSIETTSCCSEMQDRYSAISILVLTRCTETQPNEQYTEKRVACTFTTPKVTADMCSVNSNNSLPIMYQNHETGLSSSSSSSSPHVQHGTSSSIVTPLHIFLVC